MASRLQLGTALGQVGKQTRQRLDKLESAVPAPKREPSVPFAEYVQAAREYSKTDPLFRRQFEDALRQYEEIQGA